MPAASTSPWILTRNSTIHGRGVYAKVAIPDGTRVIEYLGERITKAECIRREDIRLAKIARGQDGCVYIFELNKRHDIDGSAAWNTARLINHSCEPNCRSEIIRGHIWITARRDIAPGEELTFDYGYSVTEWRHHPCRCGSAKCIGHIVAKSQRWRLRRLLRAEKTSAKKAAAAPRKKTPRKTTKKLPR